MTLEQMVKEDPRFDGTRLVHLPGIVGTNKLVAISMSTPDAMKLFDPAAKSQAIIEPIAKFWKGWAPFDLIAWMPKVGDVIRIPSLLQDHGTITQTIVQGTSAVFSVQPLVVTNSKYNYDFSKQKDRTFEFLDWLIAPRFTKNAAPEILPIKRISPSPIGPKHKIPENRNRRQCTQCGGLTEMLFTSRYCPLCE